MNIFYHKTLLLKPVFTPEKLHNSSVQTNLIKKSRCFFNFNVYLNLNQRQTLRMKRWGPFTLDLGRSLVIVMKFSFISGCRNDIFVSASVNIPLTYRPQQTKSLYFGRAHRKLKGQCTSSRSKPLPLLKQQQKDVCGV